MSIEYHKDIQDYSCEETVALRFGDGNTFDTAIECMYVAGLSERIPHAFIRGICLQVPKVAVPELKEFYAQHNFTFEEEPIFSTASLSQEAYEYLTRTKFVL